MAQQRPTKKQRQQQADEQARQTAELIAKQQRRRRVLVPLISTGIAVVAAAVIIAAIILWPRSDDDQALPEPTGPAATAPAGMASGGIGFTGQNGQVSPAPSTDWSGSDTAKLHVQLYIDWTCPACKAFEEQVGDDLLERVGAGEITLEYVPLAILRRSFTTDYSPRAANAAACVADAAPERFLDVQRAMFAGQAKERTAGLSDEQILTIVHDAGAASTQLDACITDGAFSDWVDQSTYRFSNDESLFRTIQGHTGLATPTLVVDGTVWTGDEDVLDFIDGK